VRPASGLRAELEGFFRAGVAAADPAAAVRGAVRRTPDGLAIADRRIDPGARLTLLAVGKAAAAMAGAFEEIAGDAVASGLAITKDAHGRPLRQLALREAGHPVPDARSEAAAREALALAESTPAPEVLVVLLSGGASALWACPLPGLSLAELAEATQALLESGASIDELNCVRKHLCELAGGRLGAAAAAPRVELLAISDVLGDRLDVIGSGPCTPDPSRYADALEIVARRVGGGGFPSAARRVLEEGARGERPESPKPGDPRLARVAARVLASNATALDAAAAAAGEAGWEVHVVSRALCGEAREAGRRLAAAVRALGPGGRRLLLAGGETTVTVRGGGRGGRSQELALAAALELEGLEGVGLLAAGTDGNDGPTDAAGAFADGGTAARGRARGVDPDRALAENDAYGFFDAEGGLLRTGPTGTNVADLVLLAAESPS
jgi:glycerate-2-kinase